jgi:cell division transport system permease protein
MRALLHAHFDAITQTVRLFWRRPVAAFLSVIVIGVGLLFPVGGYIVVANLKALAAGAGTDSQISIFLAPDAAAAERAEIERRLRLEPGVRNFRFVGKDAALKELQTRTGSGDLMAGLASNPLPDTYLVTPREVSPVAQARIADSVRNWPKVAEVDIDAVWSERLRMLANTGDVMVLGLGIVLGLAMLAISFDTIRLQVLTRTEEIAVLRLFGATPSYVRRPFLYFGALQGTAAALFAWVVAGGSLWWIEPRLAALLDAYGLSGRLVGLTAADGLALLGFSASVGLLGAWLASGEH